jgi:uncharacterized FAD-dependent dehydrogenase
LPYEKTEPPFSIYHNQSAISHKQSRCIGTDGLDNSTSTILEDAERLGTYIDVEVSVVDIKTIDRLPEVDMSNSVTTNVVIIN